MAKKILEVTVLIDKDKPRSLIHILGQAALTCFRDHQAHPTKVSINPEDYVTFKDECHRRASKYMLSLEWGDRFEGMQVIADPDEDITLYLPVRVKVKFFKTECSKCGVPLEVFGCTEDKCRKRKIR